VAFLISYEKHPTGNFIAKHHGQEIMVLSGAFIRIVGVSINANIGSTEVNRESLKQLGFLTK